MSKALLACVLTFAIISLTQCVAVQSGSGHGDLYYYHKFEKNHSWEPNAKLPLMKHYSNEKKIREALYKLQGEVTKLEREQGFKIRDMKRAILADKNKLATTEAVDKADTRLHNQREEAIKEQINHQEKFKEKYQKRFLKNHEKLSKAQPDEEPEYLALENFDQYRVKHFRKAEAVQQLKLNKNEQKDMNDKSHAMNVESRLQGLIGKETSNLKTSKAMFRYKLEGLKLKEVQLEEMVKAEEKLDESRQVNQKKEAADALLVAQKE